MDTEITRINPETLHPTPGYHHITVVQATRMIFFAGQCPLDRDGSLVGPRDLEAQLDQVVANVLDALTAVSARPEVGEVGLDQPGPRSKSSGDAQLTFGQVDADHVVPLAEQPGRRVARATAEVDHGAPGRQPVEHPLYEAEPDLAAAGPRVVPLPISS
jgi:hypothetical protein